MRSARLFALTVATVLAAAAPSHALVVNGSGTVTNWDVTPFTLANQQNTPMASGAFTIGNNISPVNYPGVGNFPSGGEAYDFEEMYTRVNGSFLEVLVVSSGNATINNIIRGDLFVTISGTRYGIVSTHDAQGLTAGSVYNASLASDVIKLQPAGNSYAGNASVENQAGPWAVAAGISNAKLAPLAATITTASYNYGGAENNTYLWEYRVALSDFGLTSGSLFSYDIHQTWGCGNDMIEVAGIASSIAAVPTPAALPMGLLAMLAIGASRRVRRRR